MANVPSWFKSDEYFQNKLATMNGMSMNGMSNEELKAAFRAAGYPVTSEGLYQHFLDYGDSEWVSPCKLFNCDEYLTAKAAEYFKTDKPSLVQVAEIEEIFLSVGLSPWDHYQQYGWKEGVSPCNSFNTQKYYDAKLIQLQTEDPSGNWTPEKLADTFKTLGISPLEHWYAYGKDEKLSYEPGEGGVTGETFYLEERQEVLTGTDGNDLFFARQGTLKDGDRLDGGAGYDELYAYVDYHNSATSVWAKNIEKVSLRAQHKTEDLGSNNPAGNVHVDLGDVQGMTYLRSDNSRAALIVEDVRTNSNQMRIGNTDNDSGRGVNFEVYFDAQHLKSDASNTTLYPYIIDLKNGADSPAHPLLDNLDNQFIFNYTPISGGATEEVTLRFRDADKALWSGDKATYETLREAMQNAIDDLPSHLKGVFSVELGATQPYIYSDPNGQYSGEYTVLKLSSTGGTMQAVAWDSDLGRKPADYAVRASYTLETDCPLIQTNIDLDNVGRVQWYDASEDCKPDNSVYGSESGDMIVGSMATRGGIERFDVKVDRGSWLSSLASTNNTLRMVTVKGGDINGDGITGNIPDQANGNHAGQLYIGRSLEPYTAGLVQWADRAVLLNTNGLTDVKEFNADGYEGIINIGARITNFSFQKYLRDVDGVWSIANKYAPRGDFTYTLGNKADVINMTVDSGIAADNDFKLVIDAGKGDDFINFGLTGPMSPRQIQNSAHLRNIVLNGGAGDDTIKSWGDSAVTALGGEGDDAIYVGQRGWDSSAVFVFNASTPLDRLVYQGHNGAQPLDNDILSIAHSVEYTNATANAPITVNVVFKGVSSVKPITIITPTTASGTIDAEAINNAIIKAINEDPILSKVLVAKDGAGHSLIVESLIDGLMTIDDLEIVFGGGIITSNAYDTCFATGLPGSFPGTPDESISATQPVPGATGPGVYTTDVAGFFPSAANGDILQIQFGDGVSNLFYTSPLKLDGVTDKDPVIIAALNAARNSDGVTLSSLFDIADSGTTSDGIFTLTTKATYTNAEFADIADLEITKGNFNVIADVDGNDIGTSSINRVNAGEGNDVVVLNAGLKNDIYFDTLVVNSDVGHDYVFNFDEDHDKFDFSEYGTLHSVNQAVLTNITLNPDGSVNMTSLVGAINADGTWGNASATTKGGGVAQIGVTNDYVVFAVDNAVDNPVIANEVTLLGTMTFDEAMAFANDVNLA